MSGIPGVDRVFVSHWPVLTDRFEYLSKELSERGITAEWVVQYDKRNLPPNSEYGYYSDDPALFVKRAALGGVYGSPLQYRVLTPAEIANALSHIYCYQKMIHDPIECALILEDDVILCPQFSELLPEYIRQLPDDWDILYPGSGCHLHVAQLDPNCNVYLHPGQSSRTADCYVLRKSAAQKLFSQMIPFALPIDWELSFHQYQLRLNVYWGEPSLTVQGSEVGVYSSTVR